jgi:hypothetical protein
MSEQAQESLPPLTPGYRELLVRLLLASTAVATQPSTALESTQYLERLEAEHPGLFVHGLLELALDTSGALDLRVLSAICAKNAVTRRWSHYIAQRVSDRERHRVHQFLWRALDSTEQPISRVILEVTAVVARYDYPKAWFNLPEQLLAWCPATAPLERQHRWLVIVNHIWKTLSRHRSRSQLEHVSVMARSLWHRLVDLWFRLWNQNLAAWLPGLVPAPASCFWQPSADQLDLWLDCVRENLKGLRRLVAQEVFQGPDASTLIALLQHCTHVERCLAGVVGHAAAARLRYLLIKFKYICFTNHRSIEDFPLSMLLPWSEDICAMLLQVPEKRERSDAALDESNERRSLYAMRFLRDILGELRDLETADDIEEACLAACGDIGAQRALEDRHHPVWTTLQALVKAQYAALTCALLDRFVRLSATELATWLERPAAACYDDEESEWNDDQMRSLAEQVCAALAAIDADAFVTTLSARIGALRAVHDWLGIEAAFRVLGRAISTLGDALVSRALLDSMLYPLLQSEGADAAELFLQARTAILTGQCGERLPNVDRCRLYGALVSKLGDVASPAHLVRALGAARGLLMLLCDLGFCADDFCPYLPDAMTHVFTLMEACTEEPKSMSQLLDLVVVLVESCPGAFFDVHDTESMLSWISVRLCDVMERLFFGGHDDGTLHLVRCQLVAHLTRLLAADRGGVLARQPAVIALALRMITFGIGYGSDASTYLIDDAFELLHRVLLVASEYDVVLDRLFYSVMDWLGNGDLLRPVLRVVRAYAMLGGFVWYARHAGALAGHFGNLYASGLSDRVVAELSELLLALFACADDAERFHKDFGILLGALEKDLHAGQFGCGPRASIAVLLATALRDHVLMDDDLARIFLEAAAVTFSTTQRARLALLLAKYLDAHEGQHCLHRDRILRLLRQVHRELGEDSTPDDDLSAHNGDVEHVSGVPGDTGLLPDCTAQDIRGEWNRLVERLLARHMSD